MRITLNIKRSIVDYVLIISLLCSFTIFVTYGWGRYTIIAIVTLIFFNDMYWNNYKKMFVISDFIIIMLLFTLYAFSSAVWAESPSDAIVKGKTLLEITIMIFVLYNFYISRENCVRELLTAIKWTCFIVVVYTFFFYGFANISELISSGHRMLNSYANVNTIGILSATGILIRIDEFMNEKKFDLSWLCCVPALVLLALTQSKKALLMLLLGTALLFLFKSMKPKNLRKNLFRIIMSCIGGLILFYIISNMEIFDGIMHRTTTLIRGIVGEENMEYSDELRHRMILTGLSQFFETPILGMGLGNAHLLGLSSFGSDTYLHNNFVELLAGGGIIGFSIYYLLYLKNFISFLKYSAYKDNAYHICLVFLILFFALDYGRVTYDNKMNYVFILLYFLEAINLKRSQRKAVIDA